MKIEHRDNHLVVSIKCRDWERAAMVIVENQSQHPDGYRLVKATTKVRSSSGNRCLLELFFAKRNPRVEALSEAALKALFDYDVRVAKGEVDYSA